MMLKDTVARYNLQSQNINWMNYPQRIMCQIKQSQLPPEILTVMLQNKKKPLKAEPNEYILCSPLKTTEFKKWWTAKEHKFQKLGSLTEKALEKHSPEIGNK